MSKTHVVAKGETLLQIAKKYGHSDEKSIWKAAENKALVGKRKKPEDIQPGDKIVIPPTEKQAKQFATEVAALNKARDGNAALRGAMLNELARVQRKVKIFEELIADSQASTKQIVEELEENVGGLKRKAGQYDNAATAATALASMGMKLGKLGKLAYESTKVSGEALKVINKEAIKEVVGLAADPLKDASIHAVSTLKDRATTALAFAGTVAESWEKMMSPSFWANAYIVKFQEGKSFSDAMTAEIGQDIEERILWVTAQGDAQVKRLHEQLAAAQKQVGETQDLVKEAEARIKWNEQEAAKLAT